jgi:hypothetical protein
VARFADIDASRPSRPELRRLQAASIARAVQVVMLRDVGKLGRA